jgi:hypothetical protein
MSTIERGSAQFGAPGGDAAKTGAGASFAGARALHAARNRNPRWSYRTFQSTAYQRRWRLVVRVAMRGGNCAWHDE